MTRVDPSHFAHIAERIATSPEVLRAARWAACHYLYLGVEVIDEEEQRATVEALELVGTPDIYLSTNMATGTHAPVTTEWWFSVSGTWAFRRPHHRRLAANAEWASGELDQEHIVTGILEARDFKWCDEDLYTDLLTEEPAEE